MIMRLDDGGPAEEKRPAPDDTSTTCVRNAREIASELRAQVRALRLIQREHGPDCNGHPVTMGHMLALRIADLLDETAAS